MKYIAGTTIEKATRKEVTSMSSEKYSGRYVDCDVCPENPVSWRFFPKRKSGKVGYADAIQELFDQGMNGNMYAQIFRVPEEFPACADNNMELMEPEDACKILAEWCHFKLFDSKGNQIV